MTNLETHIEEENEEDMPETIKINKSVFTKKKPDQKLSSYA